MNKLKAIRGTDVACIRGGRLLFRDLNFEAGAGAFVSVEGPNGAGKSSLLRLISGFLSPVAGTVRFTTAEEEIDDGELRGTLVGFLGHQDAAKPQLTVLEQADFYARLYGVSEDVRRALAHVGLERLADMPCQYLSAGQKKRLAFARLSLVRRPLWILDEPYSALDANGRSIAAELIRAHCARGGIAIAATHEPLGLEGTRLVLGAS